MIIPILICIAAAFISASTNHIDKYLISKTVKNADYRSLIIVSTIIAGGIMTLIYAFVCQFDFSFDLPGIAILLLNSTIYTIALTFWFKAISRDDVTIVVIMLQLIPVFMLFIAPLLLPADSITIIQLLGGLIITSAAILITYEPAKRKFDRKKLVTLAIMTLTSAMCATWYILERRVNLDHDFNKTILWTNITLCLVGIFIYICMKSYRQAFHKMLKSNGTKVIGLNLINEVLNSFDAVLETFAGTMTSVSLVSFTTQGVQPFAVMILGALLTKLSPKIEKENVAKKEIAKRVFAAVLCLVGLACIEFG